MQQAPEVVHVAAQEDGVAVGPRHGEEAVAGGGGGHDHVARSGGEHGDGAALGAWAGKAARPVSHVKRGHAAGAGWRGGTGLGRQEAPVGPGGVHNIPEHTLQDG